MLLKFLRVRSRQRGYAGADHVQWGGSAACWYLAQVPVRVLLYHAHQGML